jgi:hypothetical protein
MARITFEEWEKLHPVIIPDDVISQLKIYNIDVQKEIKAVLMTEYNDYISNNFGEKSEGGF